MTKTKLFTVGLLLLTFYFGISHSSVVPVTTLTTNSKVLPNLQQHEVNTTTDSPIGPHSGTPVTEPGQDHGTTHGGGHPASEGGSRGDGHGDDTTHEPGHDDGHEEHEEHEEHRYHVAKFNFEEVSTNLIVVIWILFVSVAKIGFHSSEKLTRVFPESCMLIVIGVILGIILYFTKAGNYQLNTHTFFLIILPPIILDAGYYMPARSFFDNLGTILLYAVFGTLLNALFLGFSLWGVYEGGGFNENPALPLLHCLTLAALLAAVDPVAVLAVFEAVQVNEVLYIIVFGESLLNDGISVVLYRIFEGFSIIGAENIIAIDIVFGVISFFVIVICSPAMGILCGFLAGFLTRFTHHCRLMEPIIIFAVGYFSYVFAELFHLSGILSCTFCGITMRKYVEGRISKKSQVAIHYMMKVLAQICEGIIFMYLGVSAVNDEHEWDTGFILLTVAFCLVFRALVCVILTFIGNRLRHNRLSAIDQFIMSYGGLRGAIAFALSTLLDHEVMPAKFLFVSTTVVVVYFTNIVLGSTIQPLVTLLRVKRKDNHKPTMGGKIAERVFDHTMAGIECISDNGFYNRLRFKFSNFNNQYLKPLIIGHNKKHGEGHRGREIRNVYERLSEKDAKQIVKSPSYAADINRMNTIMRRGGSVADLNRCATETSLFNPTLWGLPSFSMEDRYRMTGLDRSISVDQPPQLQSSISVISSSDPAKYARYHQSQYKKRTMNSSLSALPLTESELNDADSEGSGKRRRSGSSQNDPDSVIGEEPAMNDVEWHGDRGAIQFTVKSKNDQSKHQNASRDAAKSKDSPKTKGVENTAFSMDDESENSSNNNNDHKALNISSDVNANKFKSSDNDAAVAEAVKAVVTSYANQTDLPIGEQVNKTNYLGRSEIPPDYNTLDTQSDNKPINKNLLSVYNSQYSGEVSDEDDYDVPSAGSREIHQRSKSNSVDSEIGHVKL